MGNGRGRTGRRVRLLAALLVAALVLQGLPMAALAEELDPAGEGAEAAEFVTVAEGAESGEASVEEADVDGSEEEAEEVVAEPEAETEGSPAESEQSTLSEEPALAAQAAAMSADQAIAWCEGKVGQSLEYNWDEWLYQCVDFVKFYYEALGATPVRGNGVDYTWNDLPSGWTRVQGGQPRKGDVLVYTGGPEGYGHVAVYDSDYSTYHQNFHGSYVEHVTNIRYDGLDTPYWGYIRPDFVGGQQPIGYIDSVWGGGGIVHVSGWAFDPDTPAQSIYVNVYTNDGLVGQVLANVERPDVNNAYGVTGAHGFDVEVVTPARGSVKVTVFAINSSSDGNHTALTYNQDSEPRVNISNPTYRIGTETELPTDTSFILVPACSKVLRGMTIGDVSNGARPFIQGGNDRIFNDRFFFAFDKHSSGHYGIRWVADPAYYLHVCGDGSGSLDIVAWQTYGNDNSLWVPEKNSDGTYSFRNAAFGTYLDLKLGVDAVGTEFCHYPGNGGANQRFYLVPAGKSLADADVTVTCPEKVELEAAAAEPDVKVEYLGITLVEGEDYTVSYKGNDRAGTATATISGIGGSPNNAEARFLRGYYTGGRVVTFEVVDNGPDLSHDGWCTFADGAKGYVRNGSLVRGWLDLDGGKYWFDEQTGKMATGWTDLEVDGKTMHYYFNPASGNLARGTWMDIGGKKYYFRPSGNAAHGWATISDNGVDKKYYFDDDFQMVTGWRDIVNDNGATNHYYFRPSGSMATGWARIDGTQHYFRPSGNMATGFTDVTDDAYKRYFDGDGNMLTGWQEIGGQWYYFRPSGAMQTGEATIDGMLFTFTDKGVLVG